MKKEAKELVGLLGAALVVMAAVPLAYRVYIHYWPQEANQRPTLAQFLEKAQMASCMELLTKPVGKWSDAEVKSEPEIYAWLKEQGNAILPWEWTEEARRKDPKGYAKCWGRIWKERKDFCESRFAEQQKEFKRLDRELQILATIHTHRTNQIARLVALAATNTFPCRIALERLKKGRFWGWNKYVEEIECADAAAIMTATNSIYSNEVAIAENETRSATALSDSIASSKAELALYGQLSEVCGKCNSLIEDESSPAQDELLRKSLVEVLKGAKK